MDTTIHEMCHAMVFSINLMPAYINLTSGLPYGMSILKNITVRGSNITILK